MDNNKRNKQQPIPTNLDEYLNDHQKITLQQIENFGWQISFIRRPVFQDATVVLCCPNNQQIGILLESGEIDQSPDIKIRLNQ